MQRGRVNCGLWVGLDFKPHSCLTVLLQAESVDLFTGILRADCDCSDSTG